MGKRQLTSGTSNTDVPSQDLLIVLRCRDFRHMQHNKKLSWMDCNTREWVCFVHMWGRFSHAVPRGRYTSHPFHRKRGTIVQQLITAVSQTCQVPISHSFANPTYPELFTELHRLKILVSTGYSHQLWNWRNSYELLPQTPTEKEHLKGSDMEVKTSF